MYQTQRHAALENTGAMISTKLHGFYEVGWNVYIKKLKSKQMHEHKITGKMRKNHL